MNCKEARNYLGPYLDSQLGHTKTFEVSEHLRICSSCFARFSAERRVESALRDRLRDEKMPSELWTRLCRAVESQVSIPVSRRIRGRLRIIGWAASLLAAAGLGVAYYVGRSTPATPWVVSALLAETSGDVPFTPRMPLEGKTDNSKAVEAFGVRLLLGEPGALTGHDLRIIDRQVIVDRNGRSCIEVRLNCCGKPILMVLAKQDRGPIPSAFDGAVVGNNEMESVVKGVNLAGAKLGDVMVLVASRHPVRQIVDGLRIEKSKPTGAES